MHCDGMVTIAILVSRPEALCLADMLNAEGIAVHLGSYAQIANETNSLALGGVRIWIPASQYEQASALIREVGADQNWNFSKGLQRAVLRLLAVFLGCGFLCTVPAALLGLASWSAVFWVSLFSVSLPVNPQGRGDYFLAESNGE